MFCLDEKLLSIRFGFRLVKLVVKLIVHSVMESRGEGRKTVGSKAGRDESQPRCTVLDSNISTRVFLSLANSLSLS